MVQRVDGRQQGAFASRPTGRRRPLDQPFDVRGCRTGRAPSATWCSNSYAQPAQVGDAQDDQLGLAAGQQTAGHEPSGEAQPARGTASGAGRASRNRLGGSACRRPGPRCSTIAQLTSRRRRAGPRARSWRGSPVGHAPPRVRLGGGQLDLLAAGDLSARVGPRRDGHVDDPLCDHAGRQHRPRPSGGHDHAATAGRSRVRARRCRPPAA